MAFLTVRHATVYRYSEPVGLGEHRMMFRPRESHDLRLIRTSLAITPEPVQLRWLHDPFDNSVAVAAFEGTTRELRFESTVTLEHFESTVPEYPIEDSAKTYPFRYSDDDFSNLGRGLANLYPISDTSAWALQFLDPDTKTATMKILRSMTRGIRDQFTYNRRVEKGVQAPEETLRTRRGSCRDFAVLMMEALRSFGVAARFVTGYLYDDTSGTTRGGGSTHAWCNVYLPGAGWMEYDPTNGLIAGSNLVRLGVARSAAQALPVAGGYIGSPDDSIGLSVDVAVRAVPI